MALSNYSELKTAIASWMARTDVAGDADDFIRLAEARLNRELDAVEADADLTGVSGSRRIDISALSVIEPVALFIVDNGDERSIVLKADGSFPYRGDPGEPGMAAVDGNYLDFDCPLDAAYAFRLRYRGRFALSLANPTNDLLTNHPDVYLAACLVWGGVFIHDDQRAAGFKVLLDEFIESAQWHLSQPKRSVLTPSSDIVKMIGTRVYSGEFE